MYLHNVWKRGSLGCLHRKRVRERQGLEKEKEKEGGRVSERDRRTLNRSICVNYRYDYIMYG